MLIYLRASARQKAVWPRLGERDGDKSVLTAREYSTLIMEEFRMEGETGGIFSGFPFQTSELPEAMWFPLTLATTCLQQRVFPPARYVCVW